ncbi:hypothetical protein KY312_04365 [Candidatus Woesearchaeota archaeon]|nr:hypothetical protein [Candidatus Woesearchaeota archaeon]
MALKNWETLQILAEYAGIEIDKKKPKESRLRVALELDKQGKIDEAIEAISGIPSYEYEPSYLSSLALKREKFDAESFYKNFPDADA